MGPVTKNRPISLVLQALFILYVFSERDLRRGSPISLSSPLVSAVSPNRGRGRHGLCSTCSNRLKTSSNLVNSKSAGKILAGKENHECEQKIMLNYKQHEERKQYVLVKEAILTRHNRVKNVRRSSAQTERHRLTSC